MSRDACKAPKEIDLYVSADGFRVFRLEGHHAIGIEAMGMVVIRPIADWHALASAVSLTPSASGRREALLEAAISHLRGELGGSYIDSVFRVVSKTADHPNNCCCEKCRPDL